MKIIIDADACPVVDVTVKKNWNDSATTHPNVTAYLLIDGVRNDSVTLNAANNWFYKWEDLPVYGKSGETLVYTVREAKIKGYGTTIREATSADASSTWTQVNSLTADGTYLLVAGNNALTVNGTSLAWTDVSAMLSSGAAADASQLWTYTDSKLRNGNGRYL